MEDTALICSICDASFDSEQELREHQRTVHAAAVGARRHSPENEHDADEQETAA